MPKSKPLFVVGNKRSGSTLLVNMLNVHPQICVIHESDVVWILFQAREGKPAEYRCNATDAARGMNATLKACGDILESQLYPNPSREAVRKTFYAIHERLATKGSEMHGPLKDNGWIWCGDKKPVQQSDPDIQAFIREHFPDARFLHLIRNPLYVVASMMEAARTWDIVPDFWKAKAEEVLKQWAVHEQWVLDAKSSGDVPVHTVRLEDLSMHPVEEMTKIVDFLQLEMPDDIIGPIEGYVYANPNEKYESFTMPVVSNAADIMQLYGYP